MGNCGSSLDCGQCYGEAEWCLQAIEVDPDIAGPGVIIAFFIASAITCFSIVFAYLTDSLPECLLSDADEYIIEWFQGTFVITRFLPWLGRCWFGFKALFYRCIGRTLAPQTASIPRAQRVSALTRLLLGFSDQQLVTGLALLIAGLANRCHLSLYELHILLSVATFAATTHIATLIVLQEYFYTNPVVRNWRVIGISTFIVLLVFFKIVEIISESAMDNINLATPVQCIIDGRTRPTTLSAQNMFAQVFYLMYFLLTKYILRTVLLFVNPRYVHGGVLAYISLVIKLWLRTDTRGNRQQLIDDAGIQQDALLRRDIFHGILFFMASLRRYINAFLPTFSMMALYLIASTADTTMIIWFSGVASVGNVRRMGFGQVVSLTLLAIPLLSATEIYNEARDPSNGEPNKDNISKTPDVQDDACNAAPPTAQARDNRSPGENPAEFLQVIFRDIEHNYPQYGLDSKRIASLSISLGELKVRRTKLYLIRQFKEGFEQQAFHRILTSTFFFDLATSVFIALAMGRLPFPLEGVNTAIALVALWLMVLTVDFFFSYRLQHKLILCKLALEDTMPTSEECWTMPTSEEGWSKMLNYLSPSTKPPSEYSLDSGQTCDGSFIEKETTKDLSISDMSSVRHRHTWCT